MTTRSTAEDAGVAAERRAREVEAQLTDDERFSLVISILGQVPGSEAAGTRDPRIPAEVTNMSAGYTPGVPRLGIPALQSSDAGMGVTNPGYRPDDSGATAFPSLIALGAGFDPELVRQGGVAIGREARLRGFNVQLAGGCNLARDPRNGRNFEYFSEDPWHSATLAAEQVNGIQSQGVISTLKHYTLNCNETNRHWLDAVIDPDAHRESDLLTFQLAIERSQPGAIMCGYNKVNGEYAGGKRHLLTDVLKGRGATPGTSCRTGAQPRSGSSRCTASTRSRGCRPTRRYGAGNPSPTSSGAPTRGASCRRSVCRTWCAASCARCTSWGSTGGGRHRRWTWHDTTGSPWTAPGGASSCCRTTAHCPSRRTSH